MQWLKSKQQKHNVRLLAAMEAGELIDERALIYQTQVGAHEAGISIRNREPVGLYHLVRERTPLVHVDEVVVETGLAIPMGYDTRYINKDSQSLWYAVFKKTTDMASTWSLTNNHLALAINIAAFFIFLAFAWASGGPAGGEANDPSTEPTPTPAVDNSHGFDEAPGEDPSGDAGEAGAQGSGGSGVGEGAAGAHQGNGANDSQGQEGLPEGP